MNEPTLAHIGPEAIDPDAAKVVHRLARHGFEAYLVGGCVRDLLLGRRPKDFDVATSATPAEIKQLFRNCRIIGRRFRLAHVFFGPKIIETSTFRAPPPERPDASGEALIIRRDNVFGTAEEDARRRDFTMNGLFFDMRAGRVIDYVGGLEDVQARRVRTIGDPRLRMQEDPVRIIRAIKFAARLGFEIDPPTLRAMREFRAMIAQCAIARVLEETYRLLGSAHAGPAFRMLHRTGVLAVLFPELHALRPPEDPGIAGPVMPLRDRAGAHPRVETEPDAQDAEADAHDAEADAQDAEPGARDAEPELVLPNGEPTPEELAAVWSQVEGLLLELVGSEPEARRIALERTFALLDGLDRLSRDSAAPPVSHGLLLAVVLGGVAAPELDPERPLCEATLHLEGLVEAVSRRLRVSRRDRERLKQLLVAQRRMAARGRRTRPSALTGRDYFAEAWPLFQLLCEVTGEHAEALERWKRLLGSTAPAEPGGGRRRRRRRRGRGRGRGRGGGAQGAA